MNKIAVYLNRHLTGNVFDKDSILDAYSTDRSMLKIGPRFVAFPETTSDIRKIVRFVSQLAEKKYHLPIAVRGSGLSKTGADLTDGLVISMEKMNHTRELDAHDRLIHVQAGISLGKLNAVLAPHGLTLPVDADPRETIGSLIANAPRDKFSKRYGGIMNYVDRIEVVLANGDLIQTSRLNFSKLSGKKDEKSLEAEIYQKIDELVIKNTKEITDQTPETRLGYSGLRHVRRNHGHTFDLLPVFFGSEGSLGIITEVIMRVEVLPPRPHRLFAVFNNLKSATEFADRLEKFDPLSVELYDTRIFKHVEDYGKKPDLLTRKFDDGYLILTSFNDKPAKARRKIHHVLRLLPKSAYVVSETVKNSPDFDDFATSLSGFLNNSTKGERPNLLHDFFVPKSELEEFTKDLAKLEKSSKQKLALFGSYATDIYSVRPEFDLKKVDDRRAALTLLRDFNEMLKTHNGALAGGLPEGRLKPIVIYPDLDPDQKQVVADVKKIFDAQNIFADGVKSSYDTRSAVRHLRTEPIQGLID
ncbi:FAD-binding oxidoreductase [Candidatus Saccharibacteria bacterium]|nr:FAD-binding oxidoreductase [Candidatus Saccharibacteria bacterium]